MTAKLVRLADYVMDFLAARGVRHVFLLPGGGAMHLNDALAQQPDIRAVHCHHEQACGIAAEAYGRLAERTGVAMVTTGPGATNILTPVAGAWIESLPLLVISGQVKRADLLQGSGLRQKGVQEVDVVSMARPVTKYAVTVTDPQSIRQHLEQALHLAHSGRPGPVWLDIPLDVQAAPIDPSSLPGWRPEAEAAPAAQDYVAAIADLLKQAERPLILAGHGVRIAGGADALRQLSETLQVPVAATWNAMDLLPWDSPLCAGRPGVVALRPGNFAVQNCDLLIAIGSRLDNILTAYNPKGFARAARKVVVDVDAAEIAKLDMEIDLPLAMDAKACLEGLLAAADHLPKSRWQPWLDRCAGWKRRYPVRDGAPFPNSGQISHYHFVDALSDAAPENTLISTGSSGLAVEVFYTVFRNKPGQRVFLTSGLGSMGYGLPAAIGACLGNGSQPMIAVESDGSLQLNLQELATLKALQLPIRLFIMNNNGYASIRNTQRNYFDSRYVGTGPEAGVLIPDALELAAAYGLPAVRIERVEDLAEGLAKVMAHPGPILCDVRLNENETLQPKAAALPQPDGSMLSMPLEDMSPLLPLEQLRAEMLIPLLPASEAAKRGV
ncbi:thiamine pyrophosphate-binding protein [Chromobacterium vaccinii]|uniref:Thiamine pyrophosphate-binding protein n=1 Tax=Chromobacterium vaccinii TaxID=1108595 RepID=A0ABV0FD75_9NEIS